MAPAVQPLARKRRGAKGAVKPLKALCVQALSSHIESVDTLGLAPDWARACRSRRRAPWGGGCSAGPDD